MSDAETKQEFSSIELLTEMQTRLRNPENDAGVLATEMRTLVDVLLKHGNLDVRGNGMQAAAVGGMYFCLQRLMEIFKPEKSLPEMAEIYAKNEMAAFSSTDDDKRANVEFFRKERLVVRACRFQLKDGIERIAYASHTNQTSQNGAVYVEGELIDSCTRFPPRWSSILKAD